MFTIVNWSPLQFVSVVVVVLLLMPILMAIGQFLEDRMEDAYRSWKNRK